MITKDIAVAAKHGDIFHHITLRNADGTPLRVRVTGKCGTWKRQPEKFRLPVRHGLKSNGCISELNGHKWAITEAAAIMERI